MRSPSRLALLGLVGSAVLFAISCAKDPAIVKREALARGNQFFEQRQYAEAIIEYRKALQQDVQFAEARYKLAQSYDRIGDGPSAGREYVRAADLMLDDPDAQVRAGLFLLVGGSFEDAKSRAATALATNPRHIEAHLLLAQAIAGLKNLDGAVEQVEDAIRMDPGDSRSFVQLGGFRLAQGDAARAEDAFKRAVSVDPKSLYATLGLAKYYFSVGRLKDAEEWLKKAVALGPNDVNANRTMAAFYLSTNQVREAEEPLKTAAKSSPTLGPHLVLADYYLLTRRTQQAREVLQPLRDASAVFSQVGVRLSLVEMEEGHRQEAHKYVDEVLAKNPGDPEASLLKGRYLVNEGEFSRARSLLRKAVSGNPGLPSAHYWLGLAYLNLGDREAARTEFGTVQRLAPRETGSNLQLALLDLEGGYLDAAMSRAHEAVQREPGNVQARLIRIDVFTAQGRLREALAEASLLSEKAPKLPQPWMQLGRIFMKQADYGAAGRAFERAIETSKGAHDAVGALVDAKIAAKDVAGARALAEKHASRNPKEPWLHIYAARAYKAGHEIDKAEQALRTALTENSENLQAYVDLTKIYIEQRRLGDARQQLEAIVGRQPKAVWAHTLIAISLHLENRKTEARQRYEKILEIDPGAAMAANNLAMMLLDEGQNLDRALELAKTAKQRLPDSPEVNDTLGLAFLKKGWADSATPPLELSVKREPANPQYHYHLGLAYAQSGQKPRATAALQKALALSPDFDGAADARRTLTALAANR